MLETSLLINTAVIKRRTQTGTSPTNTPIYTESVVATVPCRLYNISGRENKYPNRATPIGYRVAFVHQDVREGDLVTVDGLDYEILLVGQVQDAVGYSHTQLDVERVRP